MQKTKYMQNRGNNYIPEEIKIDVLEQTLKVKYYNFKIHKIFKMYYINEIF